MAGPLTSKWRDLAFLNGFCSMSLKGKADRICISFMSLHRGPSLFLHMKFLKRAQPKNIIRVVFDGYAPDYVKISNKYFVDRRGDEISNLSHGLILEMGAGPGLIIKKLLNKGLVIACDISLAMAKEIKKKYIIPVIVADAESMPFKDGAFDTVINTEVIYYLQSPQLFFDEAKRVLKKSGICVTSCLNQSWFLLYRIRNWLGKNGVKIGIDGWASYFFYDWQIRAMYKKSGFEQINSKGIIFLPFRRLNKLNIYLEKTFLQKWCLSNIVWGKLLK